MYHSVGVHDPTWIWHQLTCDWRLFDRQLALLAARGYRALTLDEALARTNAGGVGAAREVAITLDDGYLDNWVFALPLLKKHGMRALVYVTTDFVAAEGAPRPTLEDYWEGRCRFGELPLRGFLNRAELQAMAGSGIVEIGSHSQTHTWYFSGAEIVDYHRPGDTYPWLAWNVRPDRKHAYREEDQSGFVPFGTPVLQHGRALGVRRWLPDPALAGAAVERVARGGGADFFARPGWRQELDAAMADLPADGGRFETDDEMRGRYREEIVESGRILAGWLGEPVRHFCWPGGAYNDLAWEVAGEAGYTTITVKRSDLPRVALADPRHVLRISPLDRVSLRGLRAVANDPALLYHACEVERGHGREWHRLALRLGKLRAILRAWMASSTP
jgi:peptidoglycan/xylan/chitin deacetylase (PgdA/CDA1 family)